VFVQVSLDLDPPSSASSIARITDLHHCTCPNIHFLRVLEAGNAKVKVLASGRAAADSKVKEHCPHTVEGGRDREGRWEIGQGGEQFNPINTTPMRTKPL
jgi:hypothetical protein